MVKAAIQSIIGQMLRQKAGSILFISLLTGCFAVFHIYLMFLFGTAFGPWLIGTIAGPMPPAVSFVSGIIFVIILFVALLKLDDDWLATATYDSKFQGEIPLADATTTIHARCNGGVGVGLPADMVILSSASNKLIVKIISVIFLFGPVVLLGSIRGIRESYKLFKVDKRQATKIIDFIYANKGRVSFDDIMKNLPEVSPKGVDELLLVDGVILLQKEMQGLALADSLSKNIRSHCNAKQYDPKQI
jgi:hypothetical protein